MPWLILHIESDQAHCELIEDTLLASGAAAVTLQDSADQALFEPDPGETPLWQNVRISGMFDAATAVEPILEAMAANQELSLGAHRVEILEDKDWVRSWMDSYQPMPMGRRLWICPSWLQPPQPDAANLILDPGLAFGTGTHPTTAMCLHWLDAAELDGLAVIDFGCGSGILAIAALLLGAHRALGTDIDPQAIQASRDNARLNGVSEQKLLLRYPHQLSNTAPVPLLMANILAGPLTELSSQITSLVTGGGTLLLSGILAEQSDGVMAAYPGFDFKPALEQEGWVMLEGRHTGC